MLDTLEVQTTTLQPTHLGSVTAYLQRPVYLASSAGCFNRALPHGAMRVRQASQPLSVSLQLLVQPAHSSIAILVLDPISAHEL